MREREVAPPETPAERLTRISNRYKDCRNWAVFGFVGGVSGLGIEIILDQKDTSAVEGITVSAAALCTAIGVKSALDAISASKEAAALSAEAYLEASQPEQK